MDAHMLVLMIGQSASVSDLRHMLDIVVGSLYDSHKVLYSVSRKKRPNVFVISSIKLGQF